MMMFISVFEMADYDHNVCNGSSYYFTNKKPLTLTINLSKLSLNLILWIRSAPIGMLCIRAVKASISL